MDESDMDSVISINLKLPAKQSHAILLCTNTKLDKIQIHEREVNEMEVTKVIFESAVFNKRVLIFQCKLWKDSEMRVCLKLMDNNEIYQNEKLAYEKMAVSEVTNAFLKVYFFCEVILPDKKLWKGYCMQEGKYSIRDILYPTSSDSLVVALEQKKILNIIQEDRLKLKTNDSEEGMKVVFKPDQTIQLSIAISEFIPHLSISPLCNLASYSSCFNFSLS